MSDLGSNAATEEKAEGSGAAQAAPAAAAGPSAGAPPISAPPAAAPPKASKGPKEPMDLKQLKVRQYLEATVVSVLLKGMQEVVKKRPDDPLEFLAHYLLEHNPKNAKADK